MLTLIKLLLIICMALYSFNAYPEILIIKKGIQPVKEKKEKKSKTKRLLNRSLKKSMRAKKKKCFARLTMFNRKAHGKLKSI